MLRRGDGGQNRACFFITQTLVPALGDTGFWTLSNFTIDGDGYIDSSAVAADSVASRYAPGIIPGHLYKVTIIVAATDEDLVVTMGGVSVATISAAVLADEPFGLREILGIVLISSAGLLEGFRPAAMRS